MNYYLMVFDEEIVLRNLNDELTREFNSIEEFQEWQKDEEIGLIIVSDKNIEIDRKFLDLSDELILKQKELEEFYPNQVKIFYKKDDKEIEKVEEKIIKDEIIDLKCENLYIIEYFNDIVTTINYKTDTIIKKEGEINFRFDDTYWEWFKYKINYQNEPLCFIILTDKKEFEIDESIVIATKNNFTPKLTNNKNYNIFKYPQMEQIKSKLQQKKEITKEEQNHSDLAKFMINKLKGRV